ncbi:MAG: sirohydrochlorin chelatase [Pseudomonadota bacterium]
MSKIGVMVCGHGSRSQAAVDEFAVVAERLRTRFPTWAVEYGYLEFANPVIRDGLDRLREQQCDRILAVPGMLFAAMHSKNDIPTVLNTYAQKHGITIQYGRELGVDPKMISAAADRVRQAVDAANAEYGEIPLHDTCLVVIGRGASDPDANSNVAKITRMLWEGFGFGWAETGYSGVTFPLVEPCLERAAMLGFKRIVVFPYFLFTGILIDRIYGFTDLVAEAHPDIQFIKAGYLNDHEQVIETFAERVTEQLGRTPPPNCGICPFRTQVIATGDGAHRHISADERAAAHPALAEAPPPTCVLCKYRTEVLGFESEVGAVQESHHHHVEGQGASAPGSNVEECGLCQRFCTGACRLDLGHDHHHHHGHGHHHHDHGHHHHSHGHDHHHDHHDHAHHHGHGHGDGHDHHHAPYPHADHPLGPESVRKHVVSDG